MVGCAQSVGRERDHNEDGIFTLNSTISDGMQQFPFGLFIVADGMGGHQSGELASALAIRSITSFLIPRLFKTLYKYPFRENEKKYQQMLLTSIQKAQISVLSEVPGGGTTLTAALVIDRNVLIAHVGDSRAYLVCPGENMVSLTRDHSVVQRLIETGVLTENQAAEHPQKNILYRAIGQTGQLQVDFFQYPFPENSLYLLCSDGLWGVVRNEDILRIISLAKDPPEACHLLVQAANVNGGPDNISVIILSL